MVVRLGAVLAVLISVTAAVADGAASVQDGGSTFSTESGTTDNAKNGQRQQRLRRSESAGAPTSTSIDTFSFVYGDGTEVFAGDASGQTSVRIQFSVNASIYDVTLFRQASVFEPGAKISYADGTGKVAVAPMEPPHYKSADKSAGAFHLWPEIVLQAFSLRGALTCKPFSLSEKHSNMSLLLK